MSLRRRGEATVPKDRGESRLSRARSVGSDFSVQRPAPDFGELQAARRVGRYLRKVSVAWRVCPFCDPRPGVLLCYAGAEWASDKTKGGAVTLGGEVFGCWGEEAAKCRASHETIVDNKLALDEKGHTAVKPRACAPKHCSESGFVSCVALVASSCVTVKMPWARIQGGGLCLNLTSAGKELCLVDFTCLSFVDSFSCGQ